MIARGGSLRPSVEFEVAVRAELRRLQRLYEAHPPAPAPKANLPAAVQELAARLARRPEPSARRLLALLPHWNALSSKTRGLLAQYAQDSQVEPDEPL